MMAAFAQDRDVVTVEDMRAAIEELQWVEYAERSVKLQALVALVHCPSADSTKRRASAASCSAASWSASTARRSRSAS